MILCQIVSVNLMRDWKTGLRPLSLFRGYERVLFRGRVGERFVVCRESDRVKAIAFSVAMKKIAFTRFSVPLPVRAVVRVLLRSQRDAAPRWV